MEATYRHTSRSERSRSVEVANLTLVAAANIFAAPAQTAEYFAHLFSQQPRNMRPVCGSALRTACRTYRMAAACTRLLLCGQHTAATHMHSAPVAIACLINIL